jgi:adenylate cyclase
MWRVRRLALPWVLLIRISFYVISVVSGVFVGKSLTFYTFGIIGDPYAMDNDFWGGFVLTAGFGFLLLLAYKAAPIIGSRTLWNVFIGLYMNPRAEKRTIVFMDLIGSTQLTERIGDAGFMRFLNDAIFELTQPIFRNGGEIYRYVGDEIIITWPAKDATRAVHCVFEMIEALRAQRTYFEQRYGAYPVFRFGMHVGQVMLGELGDLRVEIAMIGDTINTTKRIEDSCRQFDFSVMASEQLVSIAEMPDRIHAVPVEEIAVRGKAEKLRLCGLVHTTHRLVSNPRIRMSDYATLGPKDTLTMDGPPSESGS